MRNMTIIRQVEIVSIVIQIKGETTLLKNLEGFMNEGRNTKGRG